MVSMATDVAVMDDRVARLQALAKQLRLTNKQRKFAEALAPDPEENQSRAAEIAGLGTPYHVQGSKMVRLGKVQQYIEALRKEAGVDLVRPTATANALERTERKIADLAEVLEILTNQARYKMSDYLNQDGEPNWEAIRQAPPGLFRGYEVTTTTNEEGQVTMRAKLLAESPQSAAKELRAHFTGGGQAPPPQGNTVNVLALLGDLPIEVLRELRGKLQPKEAEGGKRVG